MNQQQSRLAVNSLTLGLTLVLISLPAFAAKKTVGTDLTAVGMGLLESGDPSGAIASFEAALKKKSDASVYFLLGWSHYQRGFSKGSPETADHDDALSAIDAYRSALRLDPSLKFLNDPYRLHFSLALCYEALSSNKNALASYKAAIKSGPGKALIPLHAARLRLKMGDIDGAVANIRLAQSYAASSGQASALQTAVHSDSAFSALTTTPATRKALGLAAAEDGPVVADVGALSSDMRDSLRDETPKSPTPARDPGVLKLVANGDAAFAARSYQDAVEIFNRALAANRRGSTLDADAVAAIQEKIGTAYNKLALPDMAIAPLEDALKQRPLSAGARYQLAAAYALLGKTTIALAALRQTFKASVEPADLRRYLLLAKTDSEFEAVRDLPDFKSTIDAYAARSSARR